MELSLNYGDERCAKVAIEENDMTHMRLIAALTSLAAAVPVSATAFQSAPEGLAPAGSPETRYCLRTEPVTGTRISRIECLTREEWADGDVDVDEAWAKDGVRTLA